MTPHTAFAVNTVLGDCSDATHGFCFEHRGELPASINTLSLGMGVILHAAEYFGVPLHMVSPEDIGTDASYVCSRGHGTDAPSESMGGSDASHFT